MKNMKLIFAVALSLFVLLYACKKDDNSPVRQNSSEQAASEIIIEEYGNSQVLGFVSDKSGSPLADVTVFFGEQTTLTDGEGKFELTQVSSGNNKRIWFEKDGFASTQKLVNVEDYVPNRIDASLFEIEKIAEIDQSGGTIETENLIVIFPENAFVYASDSVEVTGKVTVEATAFLTSEQEFFGAFPGNFEGVREDGSVTPIESFGFIDVELNANGEKVQLAPGVVAKISIKAPANAPAEIPMWYYDTKKGEWIEEGIGTLQNGMYEAEVTHFTPWNWDKPFNQTANIIGRVVDSEGNPIEKAKITQTGISYNFRNSTFTNLNGEFLLRTVEGGEIHMEAKYDYYKSVEITKIADSETGATTDVGEIIFDLSLQNLVKPFIYGDTLKIINSDTLTIFGHKLGIIKRNLDKVLFENKEAEIISWGERNIVCRVPFDVKSEGKVKVDRSGIVSNELEYIIAKPVIKNDTLYFTNGLIGGIRGDYFGSSQEEGYRLLVDDVEIPVLEWSNELITTAEVTNLPESGFVQIDRGGKFSKKIPFIEGDFSCVIWGEVYDISTKELYLDMKHSRSVPDCIQNLNSLEKLHISGYKVETIPQWIGNLSSLKSLGFHQTSIETLPESIGNLSSLKELVISLNYQLTTLPESIGNLSSLKELSILSNFQLTTLPESIGNLSSLETFGLSNNSSITTLPESIGNLSSLKELYLYGNKSTILPEWIGNLSSLEMLDISSYDLTTLPESFGNLSSLEMLNISSCAITTLPESFGNLSSLKELDLSSNFELTTLPESFGNLSSLEMLNISSCAITTLPESFGNLSSLEMLNISSCAITTLPESFGNLSSLEMLNISSCAITTLPESFGNLSSLKELNLRTNALTTLPESIGNLSSLEELDLGTNALTTIPESIGNLSSLEELDLGTNALTSIPESIGNLSSLEELDLGTNALTSIPESIGNLSSLQELVLRTNALTTLPESIGNLSSLQGLNLSTNALTTLPEWIGNLSTLGWLFLARNKLSELPETIKKLAGTLGQLDLKSNNFSPFEKEQFEAWLPNTYIEW
jgi:Leucine-rich repeat (LRR) protein